MARFFAISLCFAVLFGCAAQKEIIKDDKAAVEASSAINMAKRDISSAREAGADNFAAQLLASSEAKLAIAEDAAAKTDYPVAVSFANMADAEALKARDKALAAKAIETANSAVQKAREAGAGKPAPQLMKAADELLASAKSAFPAEEFKKAADFASRAIEKAEEAMRLLELSNKALALLNEAENTIAEAKKAGAEKLAPELLGAASEKYKGAVKSAAEANYVDAITLASKAIDDARAAISACAARKMPDYVVKKGDCLWRISAKKDIYDDPFLWPMIFKANADKISDPDLIYPDQGFVLPSSSGDEDKDAAKKNAQKYVGGKKNIK